MTLSGDLSRCVLCGEPGSHTGPVAGSRYCDDCAQRVTSEDKVDDLIRFHRKEQERLRGVRGAEAGQQLHADTADELERMRETNRKLHRRVQQVESRTRREVWDEILGPGDMYTKGSPQFALRSVLMLAGRLRRRLEKHKDMSSLRVFVSELPDHIVRICAEAGVEPTILREEDTSD